MHTLQGCLPTKACPVYVSVKHESSHRGLLCAAGVCQQEMSPRSESHMETFLQVTTLLHLTTCHHYCANTANNMYLHLQITCISPCFTPLVGNVTDMHFFVKLCFVVFIALRHCRATQLLIIFIFNHKHELTHNETCNINKTGIDVFDL